MQFFYNGPKNKDSTIDFFSGCLILIGFGAFIFFLSMLEDMSDVTDHALEIILFVIVAVATLVGIFQKKAKRHSTRLEIKNDILRVSKDLSIPMSKIQLDLYRQGETFVRYHLYDTDRKIALYSVYEDDLSNYIKDHHPERTNEFTVEKIKGGTESIYTLIAGKRSFSYYLVSGKYIISEHGKILAECVPEFYSYDGKYRTNV